jgi:RNA polymerase sigma-70 factor (ECF subfamily)
MYFLFLAVFDSSTVLARKIKRSDSAAFRSAFDSFQAKLFAFIRYKLGDSAVAEDILQEVFIKLWENRHQLKEDLSLKSYLYTIANNLALNHLRHTKIVVRFQQEQKSEQQIGDSVHDELVKREIRENLLRTIEKLPEKNRMVFMLSRFDDLSYREIAEQLEISIKTVESHMGKALKLLRKELQSEN